MFKPALLGLAAIILLTSGKAEARMPPEVSFAVGSTRLPAEGRNEVETIIRAALADRASRVRLTALTDYSYRNKRMAERRADVIRAMLVSRGIAANRIIVRYDRASSDYARTVSMEVISAPTC